MQRRRNPSQRTQLRNLVSEILFTISVLQLYMEFILGSVDLHTMCC